LHIAHKDKDKVLEHQDTLHPRNNAQSMKKSKSLPK